MLALPFSQNGIGKEQEHLMYNLIERKYSITLPLKINCIPFVANYFTDRFANFRLDKESINNPSFLKGFIFGAYINGYVGRRVRQVVTDLDSKEVLVDSTAMVWDGQVHAVCVGKRAERRLNLEGRYKFVLELLPDKEGEGVVELGSLRFGRMDFKDKKD